MSVIAGGVVAACGDMLPGRHQGTPVVVDDTTLRFPTGAAFIPGFTDLAYIGALPAERKSPFIIMEGRECSDCDVPPSVLVRSPSQGRVKTTDGLPGWHYYPGLHLGAGEDSAVVAHTRLFWGECIPEMFGPGVVEFIVEFGPRGTEPLRQVRITEIRGDSLLEWRRPASPRMLAGALLQVKANACHEVAQRVMMLRP
jgi:hypothetical protein